MLARESKVPPGFSGAVRVFYQGEVSGFHLTTLQLSGSSRFLITHTLGGVFELNISPSGIIFPTSFWNGQREQEYTFIYDLDKNLHGHRGRMKYLFGVWSLIWTSRACFFFLGPGSFCNRTTLGIQSYARFWQSQTFSDQGTFCQPCCGRAFIVSFFGRAAVVLIFICLKKTDKTCSEWSLWVYLGL